MNANRLLAHFERISDAPDAIDRLRRFILHLAVRGKLVEQNTKEGNATDLLDVRAGSGKQALVAKGVRRNFEDGERWCAIPTNWAFVRLGEISTVVMGSSPPGSSYNRDGEGVPLINGPVEFSPGAFGRTVINQHTTEPTVFSEEGDFLICVRGSTTGRTNISSCRACIGRGVAAIQCHFTDAYIRHAICLQREKILAMGRGIAFPSISRDQLLNLALPLPPLAEQHRIVAKVDELMQLCDRLETSQEERESRRDRLVVASLNRLSQPTDPDEFRKDAGFPLSNLNRLSTKPEHIKELRKAILNLAVRGKLVPQDEREGTAANSLRTLGMQPADPPPDFEDRVLPSSWCMIRFDDVATISGGVTLGRKLGGRKTASVPYLRVANVQRGGFDLSVIKEVDVPVEEVEKYSLKENDLLMTEGGDWDKVGRSAIWRNQIPLCLHQNHVFRVRMNSSEISPVWFERYFNSPAGRAYFESCSKQTTNLASINMRQVRGCPVPLPPLAEQKRIVTKVDELMLICDQLENQLETQQKGRRQLLEALLHEALVEVG